MREQQIDMWEAATEADAVCITTNGTITSRRRGVMGRGNALEAVSRYAAACNVNLPLKLGHYLHAYGNHVGVLMPPPPVTLVVFPVKHEWMQTADVELIKRSLRELVALADKLQWQQVVLPRPGVGNGGLDWETPDGGVRELCATALDDRFLVVSK